MKSKFIGYFRPKDEELTQLWNESVFAIDANVLLNLYRYSSATKIELEKALDGIKERIYIPHQAAKEFLKNRLIVTAGQANEYTKAISTLDDLLGRLSSSDRHPFLPEKELHEFEGYSRKLISSLKEQQKELLDKFSNDEILDYLDGLFDEKTGSPYDSEKLKEIEREGADRYENDIPPGYKDGKKDGSGDPLRKYGDLILWKQIIDHAEAVKKDIIFITDDKKEDWWLEQSGRTIGPRPELIEEFHLGTNQRFWMYPVDRFLQEYAKASDDDVSQKVIDEVLKVRLDTIFKELSNKPAIVVEQEVHDDSDEFQSGILMVSLSKPMKYATGTGKFFPKFNCVPELTIELMNSPYEDDSEFGISYGCGTVKNFNVHIRAKGQELFEGDYIFRYFAKVDP